MRRYRVIFKISKLGTGKDPRTEDVYVHADDEPKAYTEALFSIHLNPGEVIDSYEIRRA